MIKQNQLNQIADELLIVWYRLGGVEFFDNDSVESDYMVDSVEHDCRDKYDVSGTSDQQIVLNHSTRGDFLKLSCKIYCLDCR